MIEEISKRVCSPLHRFEHHQLTVYNLFALSFNPNITMSDVADLSCSAYRRVLSFNFETAKDSSKFGTQDARIESCASCIFSGKETASAKLYSEYTNNNVHLREKMCWHICPRRLSFPRSEPVSFEEQIMSTDKHPSIFKESLQT